MVLYKYSAERTAANLYKKKLWTLTTNSCLHPPAAILFPLPANPKIAHETNRSHTACLPVSIFILTSAPGAATQSKRSKSYQKRLRLAQILLHQRLPATPKPPASFLSDVKRRRPTHTGKERISMETAPTKISQGIIIKKKRQNVFPLSLSLYVWKGQSFVLTPLHLQPGVGFFVSNTWEILSEI